MPSDIATPAGRIRDEIEATGPVTFARFMELALYGDGGYYEHPPVGPHGDFVTSPHVHEVFGDLLATAIAGLRDALGAPRPFHVVEAGAGDGTLARQVLPRLAAGGDVTYTAVDVSADARAALAAISGVHAAGELPDAWDVLVANELLDNLPFRLLREGREVRIGIDGGEFVEVLTPADDELAAFRGRPDGVAPTGAIAFVDRVAAALADHGGYALFIDYGASGGAGGPPHGYAHHEVVADVLAAPGTTDITAGIDLDLLAERAAAAGARAFPVLTQRDALRTLGFDDWFHGQLEAQHRQLEVRDGVGAVRTWAAKSRATLLIDPGALGRFRWLLLGGSDHAAPAWLDRAVERGGAP